MDRRARVAGAGDAMNAEQIAEIEARAEAATPGPWMSFNTDDTYAMNIYGVTTGGELWAVNPRKATVTATSSP